MPEDLLSDARHPRPLAGDGPALRVGAGAAAVFVRLDGGRRHPLAEAPAGSVVPAVDPDALGDGVEAFAVALPGARLEDGAGEAADVPGVEAWAGALADAVGVDAPEGRLALLEPGPGVALEAGASAGVAAAAAWVRVRSGALRLGGADGPPLDPGDAPFPLVPRLVVTATEPCALEAVDGSEVDPADALAGGAALTVAAIAALARAARAGEAQAAARAADRAALDTALPRRAVADLGAVFGHRAAVPAAPDGRGDLQLALDEIGAVLGARFPRLRDLPLDGARDPLGVLAESSTIPMRRVALPDGWWRETSGPLLVTRAADHRPIAVLPRGARRYRWVDPDTGEARPVDAAFAAGVVSVAMSFYRPLPEGRVSGRQLVRFAFRGTGGALGTMLVAGLLAAALGLLVPVVTGWVFDQAIPESREGLLGFLVLIALSGAVAVVVLTVVQGMATLRLTGQVEGSVQPALWDRLLRLPAGFFGDYTAGDLANRVNGVDTIRQVLTGAAVGSLLTAVFSVVSLALLFAYSWKLALVALAGVALLAAVLIGLNLWRVSHIRRVIHVQGAVGGRVFQLLQSVPKLRVAGAEERALRDWAATYREQVGAGVSAGRIENWLQALGASLTMLLSLLVYWFAAGPLRGSISPGAFLAFSSALGQFVAALSQFNTQLSAMVECVPLYERFVPITEAAPESAPGAVSPGVLSGDVALEHVSFRYPDSGADVLRDVSIRARPGEFVAVTGPSGAGKSTILRLLLGFERADRGTVAYDDRDLRELDLAAVRRQVGVVLQQAPVASGPLAEVILGDSGRTLEDAWRAAEAAQLADEIRALPMGMNTIVSETGGGLSGGQMQRVNIARALVDQPRIVLLDEATSALDNRTQAAISRALDELQATRVVIAHRLSTIRAADRIYVLDQGRVEQVGTFDELVSRDGLFRRLVLRQVADEPAADVASRTDASRIGGGTAKA